MDNPSVLRYSLKFLSYHRQMEYWNQDVFQRGRLCQIGELSQMPLKEATWRSKSKYTSYFSGSNGRLKELHLVCL